MEWNRPDANNLTRDTLRKQEIHDAFLLNKHDKKSLLGASSNKTDLILLMVGAPSGVASGEGHYFNLGMRFNLV